MKLSLKNRKTPNIITIPPINVPLSGTSALNTKPSIAAAKGVINI